MELESEEKDDPGSQEDTTSTTTITFTRSEEDTKSKITIICTEEDTSSRCTITRANEDTTSTTEGAGSATELNILNSPKGSIKTCAIVVQTCTEEIISEDFEEKRTKCQQVGQQPVTITCHVCEGPIREIASNESTSIITEENHLPKRFSKNRVRFAQDAENYKSKEKYAQKEENYDRISVAESVLENPSLVTRYSDLDSLGEEIGDEEDINWRSAFNLDDFGYCLLSGFVPTAWDVFSDIEVALVLAEDGYTNSAGLVYVFICLPGVYALNEVLSGYIAGKCQGGIVLVANLSFAISVLLGMVGAFYVDPLSLKFPGILIGLRVVATKGLAVFVHTPAMRKIADRVTMFEISSEAPLQLMLLFFLWTTGGPLYLLTLVSSLTVIGKVNAEIYLSSEPENLLLGKSSLQKVFLVFKNAPLFASTAFFRLGCGMIAHIPFSGNNDPYRVPFFFACVLLGLLGHILFYILSFVSLRGVFPKYFGDLTMMEIGRGIVAELTTISAWGTLGRERSRC